MESTVCREQDAANALHLIFDSSETSSTDDDNRTYAARASESSMALGGINGDLPAIVRAFPSPRSVPMGIDRGPSEIVRAFPSPGSVPMGPGSSDTPPMTSSAQNTGQSQATHTRTRHRKQKKKPGKAQRDSYQIFKSYVTQCIWQNPREFSIADVRVPEEFRANDALMKKFFARMSEQQELALRSLSEPSNGVWTRQQGGST